MHFLCFWCCPVGGSVNIFKSLRLLLNTDTERPIILRRGDLIAQLVIQRIGRARFVGVERLPSTARGAGGFGSTGGVSTWREGEVPSPIEEMDT